MRGSWRPNRTATYWPPHSYGHQRCVFLVLQGCSTGGPGPSFLLSAGFLYHILSPTSLISKLTDFLSSTSYIVVQSPTQSLEWHVWSPSSGNNCHAVHRSLSTGASVYDCTAGFYLVPYCQPSRPTRFLPITAIGMCHFRRLWNGMFGRVEGQYTTTIFQQDNATIHTSKLITKWL